jgi:hypothetical protein
MDSRDALFSTFVKTTRASPNSSSDNDDYLHLLQCWRIQNCGHCIVSKHNCGWCPYSATCVPMPPGGHLLSPIHYDSLCPMGWEERWELRTGTFGCNCSTTTFLAALITCLSTLVSLLVLWILWKLGWAIWYSFKAPRGGWRIDVVEDESGEHWQHGVWVRKDGGFWGRLKRRIIPEKEVNEREGNDPDVLVVDERRPLLS